MGSRGKLLDELGHRRNILFFLVKVCLSTLRMTYFYFEFWGNPSMRDANVPKVGRTHNLKKF